jgi:GPH family glycoside/pentoside/hexuronide:cation symporter
MSDQQQDITYAREKQRVGKLPLSTKIYQGVGAIPDTFKNFAFHTFLLFFYNQVLGMPATYASIALFIALMFDAITDPMVGSLSDNLQTRLGRRHPLMYAAAAPLGIGLYLIFTPPDGFSEFQLFCWLTVLAIAVRGAMTLFLVPWQAMFAEFSDDYEERTTVLTFRYVCGWIAGVSFTWCAWTYIFPSTAEFTPGHLNPAGYPVYAAALGILVTSAVLLTTYLTQREIPYLLQPVQKAERFSFGRVFSEVMLALSNSQFLLIFLMILAFATIGGTLGALDIYMKTYFWGLVPEDLRWFTLTVIGAVAAFVVVGRIQLRFDKKHIMLSCFMINLVDGILMINLRFLDVLPDNGEPLLLQLLIANDIFRVAVGTVAGIMGASMVADILDSQELNTGRRQEGIFSSALSFSGKVTSGLGVFVGGIIIDLLQFPRGALPSSVDPDVIFRFGLVAGILIPLLNIIPITLIFRYRLTREEHARIREALDERKREAFSAKTG